LSTDVSLQKLQVYKRETLTIDNQSSKSLESVEWIFLSRTNISEL